MEISKDKKVALLFGIDTIIGEYVLKYLLRHGAYERVVVFSSKKIKTRHRLVENLIVDFNRVETFEHLIQGDDLFYCTSSFLQKTTYQLQEGSSTLKNTIPVARAASRNGVNQYLLLSGMNAEPEALLPTDRLRGELEEAVKQFPFWATHIFKPALLIGKVDGNRWGEQVAGVLRRGLDFITGGLVSKYRPLEADVVAKAMVGSAQRFRDGLHVYPSEYLRKLADELDRNFKELS